MLNSIINKALLGALLVAGLCGAPSRGAAEAGVYTTVRALLSEVFRDSERVSYVRVTPDDEERSHIEARLGRPLPRGEYTVYVATTAGAVDGYAVFDEERGQHELISFGTFFDARGEITRVEVLAYREAYGDGIRAERFRRQFVGRDATSRFRPGQEIDAISGATISSRAMCTGVERASVLVHEMVVPSAKRMLAAR